VPGPGVSPGPTCSVRIRNGLDRIRIRVEIDRDLNIRGRRPLAGRLGIERRRDRGGWKVIDAPGAKALALVTERWGGSRCEPHRGGGYDLQTGRYSDPPLDDPSCAHCALVRYAYVEICGRAWTLGEVDRVLDLIHDTFGAGSNVFATSVDVRMDVFGVGFRDLVLLPRAWDRAPTRYDSECRSRDPGATWKAKVIGVGEATLYDKVAELAAKNPGPQSHADACAGLGIGPHDLVTRFEVRAGRKPSPHELAHGAGALLRRAARVADAVLVVDRNAVGRHPILARALVYAARGGLERLLVEAAGGDEARAAHLYAELIKVLEGFQLIPNAGTLVNSPTTHAQLQHVAARLKDVPAAQVHEGTPRRMKPTPTLARVEPPLPT
jgi:hypothetical protein